MTRPISTRSILLVVLSLVATTAAATLLSGCAGEQADGGAGETAQAPDAPAGAAEPDVYQVRGQVVELPDPQDPMSGFYVHHEAIDDFKNADGEVVGMDSMTMPFPVADDLSFEGIEEGDAVAFTLEVNWDGDPTLLVTEIEPLAAGTQLEFRAAEVEEEGGPPSS